MDDVTVGGVKELFMIIKSGLVEDVPSSTLDAG
jgi:hypothetical protein